MRVRELFLMVVFIFYAAHSCMAKTFSEKEKKTKILYKQAITLYEKTERDNAHTVQVNGITMGYLDFGPKNNVPLIWAHGSNWTGYEILNVKDGLLADGYRVIAIDYRGHGKTTITDFNTSLYDIADDMADLMNHLNISKAVIGGWSKGGFVATAFYDEYPERTLGLLLEDGGSWSDQKWRDENPLTESDMARLRASVESGKKQYTTRFEAFRTAIASDPSAVSVDMAVNILSKWLQNSDGMWVNHVNPNLMVGDISGFKLKEPSRLPLMQWNQQAMIPEIIFRNLNVPMTIIDPVSVNDIIPVSRQNSYLKNQHPDLVVHEIYENTGHAAHLTRPNRFIDSAGALLARIKKLSGLH